MSDTAEDKGLRHPQIALTRAAKSKTVTKQWGEEFWLVREGAPFGFKLIRIQAGHRTSLQYHELKEEANLILSGTGILTFAESPGEPLQRHSLEEGHVVHVRSGAVHRIEATTDLTLVEVSTSELDDVIRIEDDWDRPDGRISAEHADGGSR